MTTDEIAALSQFVGTLGVIASLAFVGVQVRLAAKATRAHVRESISNGYLSVSDQVTTHADVFARGIAATPETFAGFSDTDKMVYMSVILAFYKHFENMHAHYEQGLIDAETWAAWSTHILMYFQQPGVRMWWNLRRHAFRPSFRAFLENTPPPAATTMVSVLKGKPE